MNLLEILMKASLRPLLLAVTALLFPAALSGQPVDSLIIQHTGKNGHVDIDALLPIGKSFLNNEPDKALHMASRLVNISDQQKDRLRLAHSYRFLGAYHSDISFDFDSANHYYKKAETLYRSVGSKTGEGAMIHNYAVIEFRLGNYAKAIELFTEALRVLKPAGDTETMHKTLNNLSTLYSYIKDYKRSEYYARECISFSEQLADEYLLAAGKIALVDALINQNKPDEILGTLADVLQLATKNDNTIHVILYHFGLGNYHSIIRNDYKQAVSSFTKSLQLATQMPNEWEVLRSNMALATVNDQFGHYEDARFYAQRALAGAKEMGVKDLVERSWAVLARSNAFKSDFRLAFAQLDSAYYLRDTLFNEAQQRQMAFWETTYQKETKELKIASLEEQKRLYTWLGMAGVIILIIALAFAVIRYRLAVNRRKLAEEETRRLEQEKQLVAVQATLDGEAAERTRMAKDLHDGLGSMLSLVKFNLPQVKGDAVLETVDVSRFQKALGMLDDSIRELRRVAHHMMPESLLRYGLKASLSDFCAAIPIADFHYFGDETRLSEKLEIMVYRCIHELVGNALKHAEANHINVQLVQEADRISFTVQDDGKGFDQRRVTEGMGLKNVRQRVAAFQGDVHIYSSDKGTEIHVELELAKNSD